MKVTAFWAPRLFTGSRWLEPATVLVQNGRVLGVQQREPHLGAMKLSGTVVPGVGNVHSHAFQRLMVGRTERASTTGADSFWTWREAMYAVAGALDPDDVEAVARLLYVEMLEAGYTGVGEFHYLHHDRSGAPYADVGEMSGRIGRAASDTNIRLTLLPVLYQTADFDGRPALPEQRRFVHDSVDAYLRLVERGRALCPAAVVGIAPHSLRAVPEGALREVVAGVDPTAPIHIHIAEQQKEVDASLATRGIRPVAWLLERMGVDARWCLVHATHLDEGEVQGAAQSGAVVGLCPTTEGDLGDGLFPLARYLGAGGRIALGSDSHVAVSPGEELRLLEYGQRLHHQSRNVAVAGRSIGEALFQAVLAGGARCLGRSCGSLETGSEADFLVLDDADSRLLGHGTDTFFDALVFGAPRLPVKETWVGGVRIVADGRHPARERAEADFLRVVRKVFP